MTKGRQKTDPIRADSVLVLGSTVVGCPPNSFMEHIVGKNLPVIHGIKRCGLLLRQFHIYIAPDSPITYYTSSKGVALSEVKVGIEAKRLTSSYPRYFGIRFPRDFSRSEHSTTRIKGSPKTEPIKLDTVYMTGPVLVEVRPEDFVDLTTGRDTPIILAKPHRPRKYEYAYFYIALDSAITYYTHSPVELVDVHYTHVITKNLVIPWITL